MTNNAKGSASKAKCWRDLLLIHPAAELFPMMSPDELPTLGEDIKKHKLHEPITLWFPDPESNEPELLDGRNRMDAMEAAGISVVRDDWRGGGLHQLLVDWKGLYPPADPYAYVMSVNIHRRHLSPEHKSGRKQQAHKSRPEPAAGNAVDPAASAEQRKAEAAKAEQVAVVQPRTAPTIEAAVQARGWPIPTGLGILLGAVPIVRLPVEAPTDEIAAAIRDTNRTGTLSPARLRGVANLLLGIVTALERAAPKPLAEPKKAAAAAPVELPDIPPALRRRTQAAPAEPIDPTTKH